jgi:lipopolysaccharide export system permease protein
MVLFALPAAVLMAVFVAFLRLSGDNEIMALKSSGISLYQMLPPVLGVSVITFLVAISFAVILVPWGNRSFKDFVFRIARSRADLAIKERVFCEPFDKVTFYVSSFSPKERVMRDLFFVDRREPSVTTTIVAKEGMILSNPKRRSIVIHLEDGTAFTTENDRSRAARTVRFSTYDVTIGLNDILPSGSLRKKSPREMRVAELIRNLRAAEKGGALYNDMAIELMERFSIPVAVFFMALIGASLGAQMRSGGRSLGIGISLGIFIIYYLCLAGVRSLGETGTLSPFIGVWLPTFLVMVFSLVLLKRAQNEQSVRFLDRSFP